MARHRKVYVADLEFQEKKKRRKILRIVEIMVSIFWLVDFVFMGIFWSNAKAVGLGLVLMGLSSLAFFLFLHRIQALGWTFPTTLDYTDLRRQKYRFRDLFQEEEKENDLHLNFGEIAMFLFGIGTLMAGILRLTGIL